MMNKSTIIKKYLIEIIAKRITNHSTTCIANFLNNLINHNLTHTIRHLGIQIILYLKTLYLTFIPEDSWSHFVYKRGLRHDHNKS